MSYKVCILGASLKTGNMGVSALSTSVIKNIIDRIPDAEITLIVSHHEASTCTIVVGGKSITINLQIFRLSPKSQFRDHLFGILLLALLYRIIPLPGLRSKILKSNPMLSAFSQAHFIGNIHGGDSFSDIYGKKRLILKSLVTIAVILLKKNYILLPQTYGPFYAPLSRSIARYLLKKAQWVISRDHASIDYLKTMIKTQKIMEKIRFCPDVAFKLESIRPSSFIITPQATLDPKSGWIGINVSGLLYHGGYTGKNMFGLKFEYKVFIQNLLTQMLVHSDAPILLVPHTYASPGNIEDDKTACIDARSRLPIELTARVHVLESNLDQNGVKWIIGNCCFFIGSRMHSCIAALSQGIPTIGVAYSKKFMGVFESVQAEHLVVDARETDMAAALEKILSLYDTRDAAKEILTKSVATAKKIITETFDDLLK